MSLTPKNYWVNFGGVLIILVCRPMEILHNRVGRMGVVVWVVCTRAFQFPMRRFDTENSTAAEPM